MANPDVAGNGTFTPVLRVGEKRKVLRIAATGAAVVLALSAVVAMVGNSMGGAVELAQFNFVNPVPQMQRAKMPSANVDMLAQYFLKNGAKLSPQEAMSTIKAWNSHPTMETATLMGATPAATMMLAMQPPRMGSGMSLQETSLLCEKKDKIIQLFDTLLAKLGGEELSANITYGKVTKEFNDAMSSWLDSESHYRLTVEQAKEADDGAKFASNEYEKWKTANKKAVEDLATTLARHAKERQDLADEREVIKEILRFLGVLHDVKATDKSIAAGGKDSEIDPETGVSEVKATTTASLKASIKRLQHLVLKTKLPGSTQQLAQIQKLPVYSETEEVAKVLKDMLADLSTRLSVLEEVDAKAQKLVDDTKAKLVEWQAKLVKLADDKDKAKEKMMQEKLQREQLAGAKDVAQSNYNTETDAYVKVITPYEREIYVITMIKIKITEHCDRLANGEASTFGQ